MVGLCGFPKPMDVRCDRCQTEYELDDASVSDTGTSVQCTTCGHQFIVTRRPSSPLNQMSITPPGGHAKVDEPEPDVPPWTLSTDDGKVHRFRDLNTLQKWIVERKVSRADRLSRSGGPWLALGDMDELSAFFRVVDEADRARGQGATRPQQPVRRGTSSAPYGTTARAPAGATGTPPPVPFDARKTVQPDGPTVPNRRLPETAPVTAGSDEVTPTRPARRTPGLGLTPTSEGNATAPVNPNLALTMPVMPAVSSVPKAAQPSGSKPNSSAAPKPTTYTAARPNQVPLESSRAGQLPLDRPHATNEFAFGEETGASDLDLLMPRHRGRNAAIVVLLLAGLGGGGFYYWHTQLNHPGAAPARIAAEPSAPAAQPPAPPPPTGTAPPAPAAQAVPAPAEPAPAAAAPPEPPPAPPAKAPAAVAAKESKETKEPPAAKPGHGKASAAGRSSPASHAAAAAVEPGNYDHLVTEADRLLENGQAAKAEKMYTQALAAKPDGAGALTGLAYVQLERQHHFKAIEMFRRVLNAQPTYGPALFGIAESYRGRGDNAQALTAYRQYLNVSPSGADAPAARRQIKDLESAGPQAAQSPAGAKQSPAGAKPDQDDE